MDYHCRDCKIEYQRQRNKNRHINFPWLHRLQDIKNRCTSSFNKRYKNYGGRGIQCRITGEDLEYMWFRDKAYNMKDPTLDRIDNNGHYELKNCRFLERSENSTKDKGNPVFQFDKNGNFIKEWHNVFTAHRTLNIPSQNIYNVIDKQNRSAGGFIWKLKEE